MSTVSRGDYVWGVSVVVLVVSFFIFAVAGWPGDPNSCINDKPNSCYCEAFNRSEVIRGAPGIRQPVNTLFNLYAIFTSLIVAVRVHFDRKISYSPNLMRSQSLVPDVYIFAVLFLGLGSMWFHASLKQWGGITDQLSMYVFAAFLPLYTVRRLWDSEWFFWIAYPGTVVLFTVVGALLDSKYTSLIMILILVVAYLVLQVILWVRTWDQMRNKFIRVGLLWGGSAVAIILATIFWALSQTDGDLCDPRSFFQPHGLLWHPLAGVMAVLLYFYWRGDEASAQG